MSTWAGDGPWVIAGPRPSRVEPEVTFLVTFFAAILFFAVGVFPGYVFEMDGRMDASERCPAPPPFLERGYDPACAARIVARGPLFLGRGALAVSFLLGSAAVVSWAQVSRSRRPRAMTVAVALAYGAGWAALLAWNAAEGARLVRGDLGFVT